jgi:hypothetical protein
MFKDEINSKIISWLKTYFKSSQFILRTFNVLI